LDTVRLEGAPPHPADVNADTPGQGWGISVIEGGEIPLIAGRLDFSGAWMGMDGWTLRKTT
jgi:hypothetical protein